MLPSQSHRTERASSVVSEGTPVPGEDEPVSEEMGEITDDDTLSHGSRGIRSPRPVTPQVRGELVIYRPGLDYNHMQCRPIFEENRLMSVTSRSLSLL